MSKLRDAKPRKIKQPKYETLGPVSTIPGKKFVASDLKYNSSLASIR